MGMRVRPKEYQMELFLGAQDIERTRKYFYQQASRACFGVLESGSQLQGSGYDAMRARFEAHEDSYRQHIATMLDIFSALHLKNQASVDVFFSGEMYLDSDQIAADIRDLQIQQSNRTSNFFLFTYDYITEKYGGDGQSSLANAINVLENRRQKLLQYDEQTAGFYDQVIDMAGQLLTGITAMQDMKYDVASNSFIDRSGKLQYANEYLDHNYGDRDAMLKKIHDETDSIEDEVYYTKKYSEHIVIYIGSDPQLDKTLSAIVDTTIGLAGMIPGIGIGITIGYISGKAAAQFSIGGAACSAGEIAMTIFKEIGDGLRGNPAFTAFGMAGAVIIEHIKNGGKMPETPEEAMAYLMALL